jgi:hypothetical protein
VTLGDQGVRITITADGFDADQALAAFAGLVNNRFGESSRVSVHIRLAAWVEPVKGQNHPI